MISEQWSEKDTEEEAVAYLVVFFRNSCRLSDKRQSTVSVFRNENRARGLLCGAGHRIFSDSTWKEEVVACFKIY
jgi:hypothetical protein